MAPTQAIRRWRPGKGVWLSSGLLALLIALAGTLSVSTMAWGEGLRDEGRLLPGTTIAGVDVADLTIDEATDDVAEHLESELDRTLEVTYNDNVWETTPRELGATTDIDEITRDALEKTDEAGLTDFARIRYAGASPGLQLDVTIDVPDEGIAAFVDDIADEIDRDPREGELSWASSDFEISEHRNGREVERDEAVRELTGIVDGGRDGSGIELPVTRIDPELTTDALELVIEQVRPDLDEAFDHTVTASLDDDTWETTPRELGATPSLEGLREAASTLSDGSDVDVPDIELRLPDEALSTLVANIASEVDVSARDAEFSYAGGDMEVTESRTGLTLERETAREDLRAALLGDGDRVTLEQASVQPSVTSDDFDDVLVLDQSERRLYLYDGDEVAHEWPVAVGLDDTPTPTGTFTIGAKRHEPVWHNPSPDGWGEDMPDRIGPGPDNPLGARALNWMDGGRDTLIRFHGTPNEGSIGEAASAGCVRMFDDDVIELFDLVSSGTTVVSLD